MSHPSPAVTFRSECGAAARFATLVAAAVVIGSVAAFHQGVSLVEADVVATGAQVVVAAFMPTFFGAWAFFLLRRWAWRSPGRAFLVGGAVTFPGVFTHDRVLHSRFYEAAALDLPSAWLQGVVDGVVAPARLADTGLLPVYAVTVVGVGVLTTALQRLVAAARVRR
jgi:hypothetical protein